MKDEKYQKLTEYLEKNGSKEIQMTLSEAENILGFPLDSSAYQYREFWANCTASTKDAQQSKLTFLKDPQN